MRCILAAFLIFFVFTGLAKAFPGANCDMYWRAYALTSSRAGSSPASERSAGATMLLALTVVPPAGEYLYGPDNSTEGLPTRLDVSLARLKAFPADPPAAESAAMLTETNGEIAARVRAPSPVLKSESIFAGISLPGSEAGNPAIYPGPITFWAELPAQAVAPPGGLAVNVSMSGLLCSAGSCRPASGKLALTFSAAEVADLPPASEEPWWDAWNKKENVFIAPPEGVLAATPPVESEYSATRNPTAVFSDGNTDTSAYTALFTSLEPEFFISTLEVQHLGEALLFGLLAGLLLNLMPCVLPVVSLKFSALLAVSSMTNKKKQARVFRTHCLIFAAGILSWFAVMAFLLGVAGWAWGEIFQKPLVIVLLGLVLFVLALSLFGVYSLPIFDLKVRNGRHPHWQAYASGLLATLLATPCSGPLLGGVLAWAIRQPLPMLTLSITSVGLGMSLPYLILAFRPQLVHLLPRPGTWTVRLEQLLGFFLVGSVLYLTTLLPPTWIPAFLFNLFAIAVGAWLWGQIGHLRASRLRRGVSRSLAVAVVLLSVWWGASSIQAGNVWEAFDARVFSEALGKDPILMEFTADWCPSCKALEHTTLNKKRMADLRWRYKVRTIRVDITRETAVAKDLLKALGSSSIPVIALFPQGDKAMQPVVLRDIVTPAQLEEAAAAVFERNSFSDFQEILSKMTP